MQAFHFDSVDSTNAVARRLFDEGRIIGAAYILAREQTAGRGTRGRSWLSPKDAGLYLSVVDQPASPTNLHLPLFTRAAAIACAEWLRSATGVEVKTKPINDLYLHGRKLGGILTEAMIEQGRLRALITGIGINIRKAERPVPLDQVQPISLEDAIALQEIQKLNIQEWAIALAKKVLNWNAMAARGDSAELQSAWNKYCIDTSPVADSVSERK